MRPLRLLMVEDSLPDYMLSLRWLREKGLLVEEGRRVDRLADLRSALAEGSWDAVISDYSLPGLTFREVVGAVQEASGDLPLVLFSGSIGEEEAVALLKLGVRDYVLKDRPGRLSAALLSALQEAEGRRAQRTSAAALAASEQRFSAVFRASPLAILLVQQTDQTILDANPAFVSLCGRQLEEVLGRSMTDLDFWADTEANHLALDRVRHRDALRNVELDFRHGNGTAGQALVSTEVVEMGGERVGVVIIQDITELRAGQEKERQMERELDHLQRLESVGRLASGVSHDMNNVLGAILTMAGLLETQFAHIPDVARAARTILLAGIRGRDLVKGLLDFSRKDILDPVPLDLNALVRREADLLGRTTFQKVSIEVDLQDALPPILGEASALSNVLMNLCVNACDAMPAGGALRLETRTLEDGRVQLAVQDTGEGMPPEVVARAMEPFFTTKPPGQGTGLGLSIVYGTVKAHGGTVEIRSAPGRGTRISLAFPRQEAPAPAAAPAPVAAEPAIRALRVFLVDDDELILQTVPLLLETLGHRVEVASGALDALRRLEAGLEADLLILDLNMPGMGGLEALPRVRLLRPHLPVLVATGQRDPAVLEATRRFTGVGLLDKPFLLEDLRRALAQAQTQPEA